MANNEVLKKVLEYNKVTFENLYNSVEAVQNEAQKLTDQALGKATYFPEEGKAFVAKWFQANKEVRENFRQAVAKGQEQLEHYFGTA